MKLLAIIPCYNHGNYLSRTVTDVKQYCKHILVIDDGSTDSTPQEIKKLKQVEKIIHKKNKGKGAALKSGFKYAIKNNFDAVLTIDADGQHKSQDIPKFLKKARKYDVVIGSRMHNVRNMPLRRILANSISSFLLTLTTGQKISDSQSGFRLIKTKVLKNVKLEIDGYQIETELIIKAAKHNFKIGHIKIETIYGKEVSHINPIKVSLRFIKTLVKSLLR